MFLRDLQRRQTLIRFDPITAFAKSTYGVLTKRNGNRVHSKLPIRTNLIRID
jgi:hypothetical protein